MKKNFTFFLIGVIVFFLTINIKDKFIPSFASPCSTLLIIYHGDTHFDLLMDFVSIDNNGTGVLAISGAYFNKDKKIGIIRRIINYKWVRLNQSYSLSTTNIRKSSRDESFSDDELEDLLPLFFIQNGGEITFTVSKVRDSGYVFSTGIRPIFFCEKTK